MNEISIKKNSLKSFRKKRIWLESYIDLMQEVEREADQARFWKHKAQGLSPVNFDNFGIRGTLSDPTMPLDKFIELAEHCAELGRQAETKKTQILQAIDEIESCKSRLALKYKFIDGLNGVQIAQKMNYSMDNVYKLIRKGIEQLQLPFEQSLQ